jgi:hypothetical protein
MSLLLGALAANPRAQNQPLVHPSAPPGTPGPWHEAPAYVALFAPRLYRDAYRAFTSPLDIDSALRLVSGSAGDVRASGSWTTVVESPIDAFGMGGTYDRWKVSRLYGSRRPVVARGPRGRSGIVEESWTLISPYPSVDVERLEPGTLLIVLRVP